MSPLRVCWSWWCSQRKVCDPADTGKEYVCAIRSCSGCGTLSMKNSAATEGPAVWEMKQIPPLGAGMAQRPQEREKRPLSEVNAPMS